jgi:hypothetical protein
VNEVDWQARAELDFPGDLWSQSDDFHAREATRIRELAGQHRIGYEDVLRAIDEDLHDKTMSRRTAGRRVNAVPCKPRPFYD